MTLTRFGSIVVVLSVRVWAISEEHDPPFASHDERGFDDGDRPGTSRVADSVVLTDIAGRSSAATVAAPPQLSR
jgi:hypothetical protein